MDALAQITQGLVITTLSTQTLGEDMVSSGVGSFTKQAACPSSKTLLEFRLIVLAAEMSKLVEWHLDKCDFCWAETKLLAYYAAPSKEEGRPTSIPINLRVLAESILISSKSFQPESNKHAKC